MANPSPDSTLLPASRKLACARCGTPFTCDLSGQCWCADETVRLPMPREGEDCLCPACLHAIARNQSNP